jgi:TRAF3-interacting protein 1
VTKKTGFADGLYQSTELDSGAIKDKDAKLVYLKKIMDCVSICLGEELDVRGAKVYCRVCNASAFGSTVTAVAQVVAGLEPEKTNLFLQGLARCASDVSLDFGEAVRLTLAGAEASMSGIPRSKEEAKSESKEVDSAAAELKNERSLNDVPPASRAGARGGAVDSKDTEPPSRQGGMGMGPSGLDEQIEACDGTPAKTRALLEPIINRPKLLDKLLSKPPFRFLHDVISEVIQRTSFASGLYNEVESDSAQVTDKTAKVEYLAKMIKLVGMQLNTIVEARPAKIVSGLEPNNTNRLLQLLAVAASSAPNSERAVQAVLAAEEFGGIGLAAVNKNDAKEHLHDYHKQEANPSPRQRDTEPAAAREEEINMGGTQVKETPFPRPDDSAAQLASEEDPSAAQSKRSTRPTTARRRPPKYKEKGLEAEAKDAKSNIEAMDTKTTIMVDGDEEDDMDEDLFGLAPDANAPPPLDELLTANGKSKLVREIQEEERANAKKADEEKDDGSGGIRFGRIDRAVAGNKDKLSEADLQELQHTVQVLCQSTNPLGKCMDYVHEDLSTMNKELDKWEQDYKVHAVELEQEIHLTDQITQPLKLKLKELKEKISDEQKSTSSVKARILKQEERVSDLLHMVCSCTFRG